MNILCLYYQLLMIQFLFYYDSDLKVRLLFQSIHILFEIQFSPNRFRFHLPYYVLITDHFDHWSCIIIGFCLYKYIVFVWDITSLTNEVNVWIVCLCRSQADGSCLGFLLPLLQNKPCLKTLDCITPHQSDFRCRGAFYTFSKALFCLWQSGRKIG